MDNEFSDSYDEFLFWKEVGEEWCVEPRIAEALSIINAEDMEPVIHSRLFGYKDKKRMIAGFITGIMSHLIMEVNNVSEIVPLKRTPDGLRISDIGKNLIVQGQIIQKGLLRARIVRGRYECPSCGRIVCVLQPEGALLRPHSPCKCGRKTGYRNYANELQEFRHIYLKKEGEDLRVILSGDNCFTNLNPGDQVEILGTVTSELQWIGSNRAADIVYYVKAIKVKKVRPDEKTSSRNEKTSY